MFYNLHFHNIYLVAYLYKEVIGCTDFLPTGILHQSKKPKDEGK